MPLRMPVMPKISPPQRIDIDALDAQAEQKKLFASRMGFYRLFWVFFIGSFCGVILESIWCLLVYHCFESRTGLILGPFNPVYGAGALVLTVGLFPLRKKRDSVILIAGGILGGAVEYVCSWIQQLSFGSTSWDYSAQSFNIGGRTSLLYMFFWGVLAIFWVKDIYPKMAKHIVKIPAKIGVTLTWVLLAFMLFNCVFSASAVYRYRMRDKGVAPRGAVGEFFDERFPDSVMHTIYPHMDFTE